MYPSFFSERSYVDSSTVSTLACGQRIVSVANLDVDGRRVNPSSSQGPTRDLRHKPDIAAPGTNVVAARGFDPDQRWMEMTGTSMASPHVAGVIGLMLAVNPRLTGAQVSGIIQRTASPLPGADFTWRNDAGSGRLSEDRCIEEARGERPPRSDQGEAVNLRVFQASKGDCLLLTSKDGKRLLVDGGMPDAYREHIAPELGKLGGAIDLLYVSHIDDDHIGGVLQLLSNELDWRVFDFQKNVAKNAHAKARRCRGRLRSSASGTTPSTCRSTRTPGRSRTRSRQAPRCWRARLTGPTWRTPRTCASSRRASTRRSGSRGG